MFASATLKKLQLEGELETDTVYTTSNQTASIQETVSKNQYEKLNDQEEKK